MPVLPRLGRLAALSQNSTLALPVSVPALLPIGGDGMSNLPTRAAALGYQPVPIHNGKHVRKGDTATVVYAPRDWQPDETTAIRTGRQDDGLFLARLDLDKHDDAQDPVARLSDIRQVAGDALYRRLTILVSTEGLGRDVLFKTTTALRSGTALCDWDGIEAGEILCEGRLGRANIPADPARWLQGTLETIPTLTSAETDRLLSAFKLPEEKPVQTTPRAIRPTTGGGAMDYIKARVDLIDYLLGQGCKLARQRGANATLHCGCPHHKHGDRSPSLSVTTNQHGHQVVFGKSGACIFNTGHGNDVVNAIAICEGLSYADIAKQYGPPLDAQTRPQAAPEAPRQAVAAEPSKDALRKRDERQVRREERKDIIRQAIETTPGVSKRARDLALSLLSEESLQSRTTNKQLQTRLGWSRATVIRAFRDLEAAQLGKRSGGISHVASADGHWIAAVWNWSESPPGDTPKGVHSALSDTPIVCTNFEPAPGVASEEEISSAAAVYTRTDLAHLLRSYFAGIETGKRASFKQASAYVEDNAPLAFAADVVKDVYVRLMDQRKWDLATRDIPTMEWKALKREGARARGMAVKLSKAGENPAYFSALADQFDREVTARVNRGEAPEHYRRRKVGVTQSVMPLEPIDEPPPPGIPSSQAVPETTRAIEEPAYRVVATNYYAFRRAQRQREAFYAT